MSHTHHVQFSFSDSETITQKCLIFTRILAESYRRRLKPLLLCFRDLFRALIKSLVCCFSTGVLRVFFSGAQHHDKEAFLWLEPL